MVFVYRTSAKPLTEAEIAMLNEIEQTDPEEEDEK